MGIRTPIVEFSTMSLGSRIGVGVTPSSLSSSLYRDQSQHLNRVGEFCRVCWDWSMWMWSLGKGMSDTRLWRGAVELIVDNPPRMIMTITLVSGLRLGLGQSSGSIGTASTLTITIYRALSRCHPFSLHPGSWIRPAFTCKIHGSSTVFSL